MLVSVPLREIGLARAVLLIHAAPFPAPLLSRPGVIVFLTQTFPPDAAAVGQHFGDVAREMARRGRRVLVLTSASGYEDPTIRYPRHEITADGVKIRRLPLSSLGKRHFATRILASVAFMIQSFWAVVRQPSLSGVVFSTSPPMIGVVAAVAGMLRRVPIAYWAMDLNPDQLIALGKLDPHSVTARVLIALNRFILRRAAVVIALDPLMAHRLRSLGAHRGEIAIIPPWSGEELHDPVQRESNAFRISHGLGNATVVMYSGNHTPSNPLTTLLDAAVALREEPELKFVFVGGGAGKQEVEAYVRQYALTNVLSLPYQPRESLRFSLSAADIHAVSLGNGMAGIIHPCKVYGAMSVARPILYFGPSPSHVTELVDRYDIGWRVSHGDVGTAVEAIRQLLAMPRAERETMGARARDALSSHLSPPQLRAHLCELLEDRLA